MKKGLSMPLTLIVVLILAVLVLTALLYFFFTQTGGEMSKAEANRIFYGECQKYKNMQCAWSATYDPGFQKFLKACKFLFGEERDAFSCLYSMCADCKEYRLDEIQCAGMCEICKGHQSSGVDLGSCCEEFRDRCSIDCFVCNA
jgi:hypothetical protein